MREPLFRTSGWAGSVVLGQCPDSTHCFVPSHHSTRDFPYPPPGPFSGYHRFIPIRHEDPSPPLIGECASAWVPPIVTSRYLVHIYIYTSMHRARCRYSTNSGCNPAERGVQTAQQRGATSTWREVVARGDGAFDDLHMFGCLRAFPAPKKHRPNSGSGFAQFRLQ